MRRSSQWDDLLPYITIGTIFGCLTVWDSDVVNQDVKMDVCEKCS